MNQLEIATQIFCSGKAETTDDAWTLAGMLITLERNTRIEIPEHIAKYPLTPDEAFMPDLSQRTADRTQQLIDLGFEWNEEHNCFERGNNMVITSDIDSLCEEDWNYKLEEIVDEGNYDESILPVIKPTVQEVKQCVSESNPTITFTEPDFFKGNPYIEFEMPNTKLRLYRMKNQNEAEKDLQTSNKTLSKYISASGENKEFELGFTILKK